jgi:hypothetical protein
LYGERILEMGCADGEDLRDLHIKLIGWGSGADNGGVGRSMDPVRITKKFDATTRDAVMRFQLAHGLPANGVVDGPVFRAIDREAAVHPVMLYHLVCPCEKKAHRAADNLHLRPIVCKCEHHDFAPADAADPQKRPKVACECTAGFGVAGHGAGLSILAGKKRDGADISAENKELYCMEEYPGMDKALLWALRALMHRAGIRRIKILAGYSCWVDHYYRVNEVRWEHDRSTFHLGKAVDFYLETCAEADIGDFSKAPCAKCADVHRDAMKLCGFQLGWQDKGRVSVAELRNDVRLPASPFSIHLNTVRRGDPSDPANPANLANPADFVQTHAKAVEPLYKGGVGVSFPLGMAAACDVRTAPSEPFFRGVESKPSGGFPLGRSRMWHGGIHLFAPYGTMVRAIADGEVVACRCGSSDAVNYGSRNFLLLRHVWMEQPAPRNPRYWYSLYMHLDQGKAAADSNYRWRRQLFLRSKAYLKPLVPCPVFEHIADGTKHYLRPLDGRQNNECRGVVAGDAVELHANANVNAVTLDDYLAGLKTWAANPAQSTLARLADPAKVIYAFTKLENADVATLEAGLAGLATPDTVVAVPAAHRFRVAAGESIGQVGAEPSHPLLSADGPFVHLEVFSEHQLLTAPGWTVVDGGDAGAAADRRAAVNALLTAKVIAEPPDKVLLSADLDGRQDDILRDKLRSVILKMPSLWKVDWLAALDAKKDQFARKPKSLADAGADFNTWRWWDTVAAADNTILPTAAKIFHYHPLAFLLALAYP